MQIILGTAQLTGNYGYLNKKSKNEINEGYLNNLFKICIKNNIKILDTSINYRKVHEKIGNSQLRKLKIISKISIDKFFDSKKFNKQIKDIFNKLNCTTIDTLLIHNPESLNKRNIGPIIKHLENLKVSKKVKKIGISIYEKKDLKFVKGVWVPDVVQLPLNIFNRNLLNDGTINFLKNNNIEIHIRSIFLQGLLLMSKTPKKFEKYASIFNKWHRLTENKLDKKIYYSLKFINQKYKLDKFVIGFENIKQIKYLVKSLKNKYDINPELNELVAKNKYLIDPRKWK